MQSRRRIDFMKINSLIILSIMVLLNACTMVPEYTRPAAPVPDQWPTGPAYSGMNSAAAAPAAELPWRDFITDERLRNIIDIAFNNNRDLRVAALNVERVRALYNIQRAEILPSVNAVGSMSKGRIPADLSATGSAYTAEQYGVNLGITSWEIDFFGRIRSLKDRALEEYLATDQARRNSQIMLLSTLAQAYLALAADREALRMVTATLEAQEATYSMIKKRYDVGVASELDLRRAQSLVETAKGDVARYTQLAAQDENALNLLAGSPVPPALLPADLSSFLPPKEIISGLSSELLLFRPDVLAAEHRLKAANANIGAARAALFPRISLTTSIGTASAELSGLFKDGSSTWNFAPQIVMPIFDARTWYAYDVTKIEKEISVAQYEKSIQTAFREVADALAERGTIDQRVAAQQSLVNAVSETCRLTEARYEKGIDSYLSVLDAQRSLYAARQALIFLQLSRHVNSVALYKVLGGGSK